MRNILVVCQDGHITQALKPSIAHLEKSSDVEIVIDLSQTLDLMAYQSFDLTIIDFPSFDMETIGLLEILHYIDASMPIILILDAQEQPELDLKFQFQVRTLRRPYKSVQFLRLADRLLHRQLNRYRHLAEEIQAKLWELQRRTNAKCAFLVEESGHILLSTDTLPVEALAQLAEQITSIPTSNETASDTLDEPSHRLFTSTALNHLRLALLTQPKSTTKQNVVWKIIDTTVLDIIVAFNNYQQQISPDAGLNNGSIPRQTKQCITLSDDFINSLPTASPSPTEDVINWQIINQSRATPESQASSANQVNWDLISDSNLLQRLDHFCSLKS